MTDPYGRDDPGRETPRPKLPISLGRPFRRGALGVLRACRWTCCGEELGAWPLMAAAVLLALTGWVLMAVGAPLGAWLTPIATAAAIALGCGLAWLSYLALHLDDDAAWQVWKDRLQ